MLESRFGLIGGSFEGRADQRNMAHFCFMYLFGRHLLMFIILLFMKLKYHDKLIWRIFDAASNNPPLRRPAKTPIPEVTGRRERSVFLKKRVLSKLLISVVEQLKEQVVYR